VLDADERLDVRVSVVVVDGALDPVAVPTLVRDAHRVGSSGDLPAARTVSRHRGRPAVPTGSWSRCCQGQRAGDRRGVAVDGARRNAGRGRRA
jgi:hypothetical protein